MKKIAIVIHRFGKDVNGGAEVHAKMISDHLSPYYDIDILTTTIKDWNDRSLDYPEGAESEDSINIIRFGTIKFDEKKFKSLKKRAKTGRKIRLALFSLNILKYFSAWFTSTKIFKSKEKMYFEQYAAHSPQLLSYIRDNQDKYDAIIFMTYYFSNTLFGGLIAPHKSILVPTAHKEKEIFFSLYSELFSKVRHIAFNTTAEKKLCEDIFGKHLSNRSVVATGIELKPSLDWESVKGKYNLPDNYILYLGRVTYGKINTLLDDFIDFKRNDNSNIKLVLTGGIDSNIPVDKSSDIIFTGFVSEEEKSAIIEHATLMVNPSRFESLSLLLLEGLSKGIPVLVNGKCDVLKEHCFLSDGACTYYTSRSEFKSKLQVLLSSDSIMIEMSQKGKKYVDENYSWETIVSKFRRIIDSM